MIFYTHKSFPKPKKTLHFEILFIAQRPEIILDNNMDHSSFVTLCR